MNEKITEAQKVRVQKDWSKLAGEELEIHCDYITAPVYAFGSELACLRLHYKMEVGIVDYSENLKCFYYCNK